MARRQREAADDRERGILQQQTRAQLPVEPRARGQADIHTRHSSALLPHSERSVAGSIRRSRTILPATVAGRTPVGSAAGGAEGEPCQRAG